ncbi:MAG: sigma-E processing peptidase SpoIIGA [Clostridiaceae bacterium]|nr:sigma-E processing peptidase SpoIIGA [Clostridiaceae bacterium]
MYVYIDLLFLENILVNYGILSVTGKLSGMVSAAWRRLISAVVGAVYLVIMLSCPAIRSLYTIGGKVVLSFLMVAAAFPLRKIKNFFKALLSFYIATFIFAGAGYALMSLTGQMIYYKNGIYYNGLRSDTLLLILTICFGFLLVRAFTDLFRKRIEKESYIVNACISIDGRTVSMPALIDTGNTLLDPVTRCPVMVAELDGLKELLPPEMLEWAKNWSQTDNSEISMENDLEWIRRIRLIPFNSIGNTSGVLPGFKPDSISVEKEDYCFEKTQVVVCICKNRLSAGNQYRAIISPEMVSA